MGLWPLASPNCLNIRTSAVGSAVVGVVVGGHGEEVGIKERWTDVRFGAARTRRSTAVEGNLHLGLVGPHCPCDNCCTGCEGRGGHSLTV